MGHIYFLTWNKWQGAPAIETTHTPGKRTGGLLRHLVLALALAFPACALALPDGGQISAGSGNIGQNGSTLTVTQTSPKLAINWQGFNIGQSETVHFNQPGTGAIALNRVLGQAPSQILGNLRANGQVFVLNPNGVLFGHTAQVNVNGLVASSLSLNDADFLAGSYTFRNSGAAGSVVNQGTLTATNGGYLALLAPEARNEGVISATLGTALLAAGDTVTLHLNNGSLLSYTIDQGTLNALAENKHLIRADGGQVILSAQAADLLTRSVVNNTGIIEAHTIQNQGGVIKLLGDMQGGQANVSGTLDASGRNIGETGGTVKVLGDHVALFDSARIDVSGASGGGTALVGGNFQGKGPEPNASTTFVAQGAQLNADALTNGNGGKVILWADGTMRAFGSISARGGAQGGNGGFVEVSGKQSLGFSAAVDTSAPNGRTGSLLLDPLYAIISTNPDGTVGDTQTINATSLVTNLNTTDITVQADTKVTVDTAVNASANANAHNLALDTPTIDLNAAITLKTGGILSGTAATVNVNSPAASIQNGVDVAASGGTVNVAAGTYTLATRLDVNKPLTLRGAQHGIDPRTAAALRTAGSGAETIVDGNNTLPILLRIGGNNVTVDGFEFRNGTGDLIDSTAVISAPVIRYNLIHHSAGPGDEGVQIRNSTGAILEYNRVYDTGIGDGLNLAAATNGTIRFNEVHDNSSVNAAIYVYGSTNTTIQGNYVHDVHDKEGIKLGDSGGGDVLLSGGSIIDNVVENTFSDGITVYTSNVTVSGNEVSNSRSLDGAIFVYYNVNNVAITNNTISNNGVTSDGGITYAIRVGYGTKFPSNVTVTGNTFSNNEAQFFDNNGSGQIAAIFGANTFDRSAMVSGDNRIWSNIQDGINVAAIGNTVTVGAGTYSEAVNISTDSVTMKLAGNTTINSLAAGAASTSVNLQNFMLTAGDGSTTTYSGIIGGTGSLAKTGSGALTLSGSNTYGGTTTVSAGTLVAANAAALGSTAGSTTVANSATLEIANITIGNEAVTLNGTGIGGAGALTGSGTASLSGPVTLATASALGAAAGNTLTLSGMIEGAGALDVLGGGTVTLGGTVGSTTALASFSGAAGTALAVNGGLLKTSGAQTYGGATTFGGATTLRTTAGGNISAPGAMTATAGTLTLDTGAGDATFTNSGNDFSTVAATSGKNISFVDANALAIAGIAATGLVDVRTQTGDLTLNSAIATTSTSGNAVTLVADAAATPNATGSGGNFKNAGAAAITTGDGGAWRIYTGNPTGTSRGGLAEGGKRYNVDDGSDPLGAGNRLYFRIQPTLTLTADNKTKIYGDANPAFTYSYVGLIDSDLLGGAISSGPSFTVGGSTSTSGQLTADTLHNIIPDAIATNLGYSLGYANGALTVNQKALTITATGVNKVYDTGTGATVTYADNRVAGDLLTIGSGTAAYLDKNVGTGKTVTVSGITLGNMDAGNYTFNTTAATIADITAANLAVTGVTAANKVYDGTTTATLLGTGAITALGGDAVSLGGSGSGVFADKNVALGKAVTVSGYSISGADADNYSLLQPSGLTANITARPLTVTATGVAKVYDGTTGAIVTYADNRVAGDLLSISGTASYLDKNVGTGKAVNVSDIALGNMDGGNYSIVSTTAATTADIIARALTIAANDATKTYTGIAYFGGNGVTYTGFASGETSAVLDGTLAYGGTSQGAINAGSYLITPSGLTAGNYSITYTDGVLTVRPAPAAGGMLPAVAEAVVALPGDGANLLTAFNAARTAAITPPVTPVLVPSSILDVSKPQSTGVGIENNHTVEQVGNLTLVDGGVKLPADTKSSPGEGEKEKSDANTSGE